MRDTPQQYTAMYPTHLNRIKSADGTSLYSRFLAVPEAKGTLLWVHGAFEHSGRYAEVMDFFANQGYCSIIFDLRGHGLSGGKRAHVRSMDDYLADVVAVYTYYKQLITAPVFAVGHSTGSLIWIRHLEEQPDSIPLQAALLVSPFLGVQVNVPVWKLKIGNIIAHLHPSFALPNNVVAEVVTHDEAKRVAHRTDPLILKVLTVGWFRQMLRNHILAQLRAAQIQTPVHIFMSDADLVVNPKSIYSFYERLQCEKSLTKFDGLYHELLNETDRHKVYYSMLEHLRAIS